MTITTLGTAAHITPTVIRTVFSHFYSKLQKAKEDRHTEATDELLFDEAFNIVKRFIELATHDTVESLQKFANTHVPAPPWATAIPTMVPMDSCFQAAELLKQYFGPQDIKDLVGGDKWWQIRGIAGVQAEWIAQTSDWKKGEAMARDRDVDGASSQRRRREHKHGKSRKRNARHEKSRSFTSKMPTFGATSSASQPRRQHNGDDGDGARISSDDGKDDETDEYSEEMDRLERTMLYIHGGGYYFGSMSTHRYQIIRFARKFGGRCFAPVYRKAPQFPWPCALQDCLASYLYLIRPLPGAKHKAVDPSKLVIAGDSAGGGLSLALLTVLRDLELPMPAGAVLISPWCDMTHSFPSILANTETDIIPPYSFVHKPSTLWPVPGVAPENTPSSEDSPTRKVPVGIDEEIHGGRKSIERRRSSKRQSGPVARKSEDAGDMTTSKDPREQAVKGDRSGRRYINGVPPAPNLLYSEPVEVQTADAEKANVQLRSQIQLYATNAQLQHPLCSPILQGSLGGLPPLYIIAGNAEVLRDEIVYLAHRAAHPPRYPLRADLIERSVRARENAARFDDQPTKVHLQIYDDMCHVLTLFAFTTQSRFAYRAVASFVKHVTGAPTNLKNPFPDVAEGDVGPEDASQRSGSEVLSPVATATSSTGVSANVASSQQSADNSAQPSRQASPTPFSSLKRGLTPIDTSVGVGATTIASPQDGMTASPLKSAPGEAPSVKASTAASNAGSSQTSKPVMLSVETPKSKIFVREQKRRASSVGVGNEYTGQVPLTRPSLQSYMIRERVNVKGFLRPLEPESELQALRMNPDEIGRIHEGPCSRYLTGQELWAKKFEKTARKVEKKRAKNEETAQKLLEVAAKHGLLEPTNNLEDDPTGIEEREGVWSGLGALGPTGLVDETPPPSALAGRRDTEEALALLRTALHVRAEQRGVKKSKLKIRTVPQQSNAEKPAEGRTRYGLKLWNYLMIRGGGATTVERRKKQDEEEQEGIGHEHGYVKSHRQTAQSRTSGEEGRGGGWTTQEDEAGEEAERRAATANASAAFGDVERGG